MDTGCPHCNSNLRFRRLVRLREDNASGLALRPPILKCPDCQGELLLNAAPVEAWSRHLLIAFWVLVVASRAWPSPWLITVVLVFGTAGMLWSLYVPFVLLRSWPRYQAKTPAAIHAPESTTQPDA